MVTPGKLDVGPWLELRPVGAVRAGQPRIELDPDTLIGSASTGASLWDGFIPDPVEPGEPESGR